MNTLDATIVEPLKDIPSHKIPNVELHLDQTIMDSSNEKELFSPTKNTFSLTCILSMVLSVYQNLQFNLIDNVNIYIPSLMNLLDNIRQKANDT